MRLISFKGFSKAELTAILKLKYRDVFPTNPKIFQNSKSLEKLAFYSLISILKSCSLLGAEGFPILKSSPGNSILPTDFKIKCLLNQGLCRAKLN